MDEHQRYVYNLALRVVKDENEALDLTQETFVRAWTALPNFKGQSQFRTWLYRIVTNLCYNRLPNLRRSLNDLGDDVMENIPETTQLSITPLTNLNPTKPEAICIKRLKDLDENYRLLITLRYQNELSYEEIASTLNLPLGTVKTGIFRAKAQLRNALATLGGLMDNRLTPEQENAIIEDALKNYPLAPMPRSITANVMARIQKDVRPALVTWNDFALSLVIALCIGALFFASAKPASDSAGKDPHSRYSFVSGFSGQCPLALPTVAIWSRRIFIRIDHSHTLQRELRK